MLTKVSDAQIEAIKEEANKEIRKEYRSLGNDTVGKLHIIHVLKAYKKVMKREI